VIKLVLKLMILPVLGLLFIVVPLVQVFKATVEPDLTTLQTPGTESFQVQKAGTYTVWRKSIGIRNDSEFHVDSNELPPGLTIQIRKSDDGTTVPIVTSLGASVRSINEQKVSLIEAELQPGGYDLIGDSTGEPVTLVVSKDKLKLKGFLLTLACFGIGTVLLIVGIIYALYAVLKHLAKAKDPNTPASKT